MQRLYNVPFTGGDTTIQKPSQTMKKFIDTYRVDSARAEWWDYARNGRYYVTICTENREHYFGKIVKKTMRLSHVGVIADIMWHEIKNHTKYVELGVYQVMPNHLHGILHLNYPKIENYDLDRGRHVETYMWDFDSLDVNKIPLLKEYLKDKELSVTISDYLEVPIIERLEIAEGVYRILGRDDDFWCRFYRVKGYHYDGAKNNEKARESRAKALEIAEQMKLNKANEGRLKEILFITGAMKYFLDDKDSAIDDFKTALTLKYKSDDGNADRDTGFNEYLDQVLNEYIAR